jgi:hypothetical protein
MAPRFDLDLEFGLATMDVVITIERVILSKVPKMFRKELTDDERQQIADSLAVAIQAGMMTRG